MKKKLQCLNLKLKLIIVFSGILTVNICSIALIHVFGGNLIGSSETNLAENSDYSASISLATSYGVFTDAVPQRILSVPENPAKNYWIAYVLLSTCSVVVGYTVIQKMMLDPVHKILQTTTLLSQGDIPGFMEISSEDEMGKTATNLNAIIKHHKEIADFSLKIGNGDVDKAGLTLRENDLIGSALLAMQDQIKSNTRESFRRSWENKGFASISDILIEDVNLHELSERILSALVRYLSVSAGEIYIQETNLNNDVTYVSYAGYASEDIDKKVFQPNEGLVGQAAVKKETVFLTQIPSGYMRVSSGIGESSPCSLLIVPLKINDAVQGVLELGALRVLEDYEIKFVERLSEGIAGAIAGSKANERTQKLLDESRAMNETLKLKEETLRESASQLNHAHKSIELARENMRLQIIELEKEKIKNEGILEGCVDAIVSFKQNGEIIFFNRAAEVLWGIEKTELEKSAQELFGLEIISEENDMIPYYTMDGRKEKLIARTEINIEINASKTPILITISRVKSGEEYFFTAFIQQISVELF